MLQKFFLYKFLPALFFLLFVVTGITAQCPLNIGFENGNFQNWNCYTGNVDQNGVVHLTHQGVIPNRHVIIKNDNGPATDPYGHFPVSCPNGSNYSIRLGNDRSGAEAERISYTFTIPAGTDDYSVIYNYAVVFQDPGHLSFQQPRFTARVFDIAANQYIQCSSYEFIAGIGLPGFFLSDVIVGGASRNIYCKPWSQATIKLSGYAGKAIRLEFTTSDCIGGEHFGYAYIDVDNDCGTVIKGNTHCTSSRSLMLIAPSGYAEYNWYDATFTSLLGTATDLYFDPVPPEGTLYSLIIKPYPGSGCIDTLHTAIKYKDIPFAFHVLDSAKFCTPDLLPDLTSPVITSGSSPGLQYSYFTDPLGLNNVTAPAALTIGGTYYIKAADGTGCTDVKPVIVTINNSPVITVHDPSPVYYPSTIDLTAPSVVSSGEPGLSFSYWKDAAGSILLPNPDAIETPGTFYIKATNKAGCSDIKPVETIINIHHPPDIFSPNGDGIHDVWEIPGLQKYPQCSVNIFNSWGQLIFHSTGYSRAWDGKINGKIAATGTYYYIIKISGRVSVMSGYVDIIY